MKRVVAALLATAAVASAAPPVLAAQSRGSVDQGGRGVQLRTRTDQLEQRIRRGLADGSLDRREADRVLNELAAIRRTETDRLARNRGYLPITDRVAISARLDQLERGIRWLRRNDQVARPGGYDYGFGRDFWRGAPRGLNERLSWLEERVRRGTTDGSLTRAEANRVRDQLRDFRRTESDMLRRDGRRLSARDEATLQRRLNDIADHIRWLRRNDRRR